MSDQIPAQARRAAGRLAELFEADQKLAVRQNEAHSRLVAANGRLWSGLHPDALGLIYEDTHPSGIRDDGRVRSELAARLADARRRGAGQEEAETELLRACQEAHWQIHRAFSDYQTACEERRHLACEVGEATVQLVDALREAGWSEAQAREADVHQLATTPAA